MRSNYMVSNLNKMGVLLWVIGAIAGIFILKSVPLEITPDSCQYLMGARFIARGEGYLYAQGEKNKIAQINWPPIYSTMIALATKIFSKDEISSAKIINFLGWVLFLATWFVIINELVRERWQFIFLACLILLQWGMHLSLVTVASELLFAGFLGLLGVSIICLNHAKRMWCHLLLVILIAFLVSIATLTRYIGIAFFPAIAFNLWTHKTFTKLKVIRVIIYFGIVASVLGIWLIRNKLAANEFTFLENQAFFKFQLYYIWRLTQLFLDYGVGGYQKLTPINLCLAGLVVISGFFVYKRHEVKATKDLILHKIGWMGLALVFYLGTLLLLQIFTRENFFWSRYFWPLSPFVVGFIGFGFRLQDECKQTLLAPKNTKFFSLVFILFVALILCTSISRSWLNLHELSQRKSGPLAEVYFKPFNESPWVFEWMQREVTESDIVFSNFDEFLSWATNKPTGRIPSGINFDFFQRWQKKASNIYIILYKNNLWRKNLTKWSDYKNNASCKIIREDESSIILAWKATSF